MSIAETIQTLNPDDDFIKNDLDNILLTESATDIEYIPSSPDQATLPVSFQTLLDQAPDMNSHLRSHLERLAAEEESRRAEITPEHHLEHITIAESIIPDIESRPIHEQDLLGEVVELGETALDSVVADESILSKKESYGETKETKSGSSGSDGPGDGGGKESSEMSPEERQKAASSWLAKHSVTEELSKSDSWRDPNVTLELAEDETVPHEYATEVAVELIKKDDYGLFEQFEQNIDRFPALDESVVNQLLETSFQPTIIFSHPEKFVNLKFDEALQQRLIESGSSQLIVEHSEMFNGLVLDGGFADRLIATGDVDSVIDNINKFNGLQLDSNLLDKALENPQNAHSIVSSLDKFKDVDANEELARRIINIAGSGSITSGIEHFHDLSNELFAELVATPNFQRSETLRHPEVFTSLTTPDITRVMTKIALKGNDDLYAWSLLPNEVQSSVLSSLISKGVFKLESLSSYSLLNNEIAKKLIDAGYSKEVFKDIEKFPDFKPDLLLSDKLLAEEESNPDYLLAVISKFPAELHDTIAKKLIDAGWADRLDFRIQNGDMKIDSDLADSINKVNNTNGGYQLLQPEGIKTYLELFPDTDPNILAARVLSELQGNEITKEQQKNVNACLQNLKGLTRSIAEILLSKGMPEAVSNNIENFTDLDSNIAEMLIAAKKSKIVILNRELFSNFNITAGRATELLETENDYSLIYLIKLMDPDLPPKFNNELAHKVLETNGSYIIGDYIGQFEGLDSEVAKEVILRGYGNLVLDNVDHFEGLTQLDLAKLIISVNQAPIVFDRISRIEGIDSLPTGEDPIVDRFVELLKDKDLVNLIGNNGPLNVLAYGFINLYMHSDNPEAVSSQLKALADGDTALWRINHEYARLLVGEVGEISFLDDYIIDAIPMSLPRKDIGGQLADVPNPVSFSTMDVETRKLILSQEFIDSHPDLMAVAEIGFNDLTSDTQDTLLAYRLYESIATTRDPSEQERASTRNKAFAEAGEYWHTGDLAHATSSVGNLRQILLSGILCGETIGAASARDSYPFNVDTVVVSDRIMGYEGHSARLDGLANSYFGNIVLVMHRTPEVTDFGKELEGGMNEDHRLIFGAVPGTEISAIMLRGYDEGLADQVIDSIVGSGIYIPVVNQQGRTILTYEEYQTKRADGNYVSVQPKVLDSSFKREGTQGGSNEGAIFIVPTENGTESYYVKFGDESALKHDHLWTEILADRLYRTVTPELVPETDAVIVGGRLARSSKMVEVAEGVAVTNAARNAGFIMDTFLGNWDAVFNADNLVMTTDGRALRIDTGNSLDFRAQGEHKPMGSFGETVTEIESGDIDYDLSIGMRQKYPELTDEMIVDQVKELKDRLPDEMIDALTESIRRPKVERDELARILKARKKYLIDKFLF